MPSSLSPFCLSLVHPHRNQFEPVMQLSKKHRVCGRGVSKMKWAGGGAGGGRGVPVGVGCTGLAHCSLPSHVSVHCYSLALKLAPLSIKLAPRSAAAATARRRITPMFLPSCPLLQPCSLTSHPLLDGCNIFQREMQLCAIICRLLAGNWCASKGKPANLFDIALSICIMHG